jgi:hypothetical protein
MFLMVHIKIKNNLGDLFLVTLLSAFLVIVLADSNLSQFSVNALAAYKGNYYVNIQEDSGNDLGASTSSGGENSTSDGTNQSMSGGGVTNEGSTNSGMSNDTGDNNTPQGTSTNSLDEGTTNSEGSNDTVGANANQTSESSSSSSAESQSNQNVSQNVESQNQLQANQNTSVQNEIQNNPQVNVNNTQANTQTTNIQLQQKLESEITEKESEKPIPLEEQKRVETQDVIVIKEHKALTGPNCRSGDVLNGASNEKDLRVLNDCQDATGVVMHTKKMNDGDYKFFLNVDKKYDFLLNDKNREKTDGFLVVEIVPKDQHIAGVYLPKSGDHVHTWGAWVTDKPKGWHEIHPAWKVEKQ